MRLSKCTDMNDMCLDESDRNNEFICVPNNLCRKLVAFYGSETDKRSCLVNENARLAHVLLENRKIVKRSAVLNDYQAENSKNKMAYEEFIGCVLVPNTWNPNDVYFSNAMIKFCEPLHPIYGIVIVCVIGLVCLVTTIIFVISIMHNRKSKRKLKKMIFWVVCLANDHIVIRLTPFCDHTNLTPLSPNSQTLN